MNQQKLLLPVIPLGKKILQNRNLLCTDDLSLEEIDQIIQTATLMKKFRYHHDIGKVMKHKTFIMFFHSPSVRTRLSFESALTELGGHAIYLTPDMGRFKNEFSHEKGIGESIVDFARVMSCYASAIGIRIMENQIEYYGQGHKYITEVANSASVPVINMADDMFHPCQGLAEFMTLNSEFTQREKKPLNNKRYLLTWAHGKTTRGWNSVQESLLLAARHGMNIRIARPNGYDLDPELYKKIDEITASYGTAFETTSDREAAFTDVDVVCSRNWISPEAYFNGQLQKEKEIEKASHYNHWTLSRNDMKTTNSALFTHPMPIERDIEAESSIIDNENSLIYKIAENRLHIQKAILYHMSTYPEF